jgi:hypothetical protein
MHHITSHFSLAMLHVSEDVYSAVTPCDLVLWQLCQARGSTAAALASAAAALAHLMVGQGNSTSIKEAFYSAGGLRVMARLLLLPTLPDKVKAAAATCIEQYLAPVKSSAAAVPITSAGVVTTTGISNTSGDRAGLTWAAQSINEGPSQGDPSWSSSL